MRKEKRTATRSLNHAIRLEPNPANQGFGRGGDSAARVELTFEQDNANRGMAGGFVPGIGKRGFAEGGIIALLREDGRGKVGRFCEVRALKAGLEDARRKCKKERER